MPRELVMVTGHAIVAALFRGTRTELDLPALREMPYSVCTASMAALFRCRPDGQTQIHEVYFTRPAARGLTPFEPGECSGAVVRLRMALAM